MAPEIFTGVKSALMDIGLPVALAVGGYFAGDLIGVRNFINSLIPSEYAGKISPKVIGVIAAAVLLGIAVYLWGIYPPWGKCIGAFLGGVGLSTLVSTLRGN
jgi:hypothetical protein